MALYHVKERRVVGSKTWKAPRGIGRAIVKTPWVTVGTYPGIAEAVQHRPKLMGLCERIVTYKGKTVIGPDGAWTATATDAMKTELLAGRAGWSA